MGWLVENLDDIEILVTHKVRDPLVVLVMNEHADLEVTEHRKLYDFLDEPFLPLAQRNLALIVVVDSRYLFDSFLAHIFN